MAPPSSAVPPDDPGRSRAWAVQQELIGPRLVLDPLRVEDADAFRAALGPADDANAVLEHLAYGPPPDRDAARSIITAALVDPRRHAYAQRQRSTGEFVGTTSLYDLDPATRSLAIGHTWLGRRWWRTGLNTEAKFLLLRRAFDGLGAERVVWHTDVRNERSQAAIARIGAHREGVLRRHRQRRDGTWRDTVQYSMVRPEWPAARRNLVDQFPLTVRHEVAAARYEGWLESEPVSVVEYVDRGHEILVTHTTTQAIWRGAGLAGRLTAAVLDDLRSRGSRVRPLCSFTRQFMRERPEYSALL